jgi:hypothetical protein
MASGWAAGAVPGEREVIVLAIVLQPLTWAGPGRRFPWALVGLEAAGAWFWAAVAAMFLLLGPPVARRLGAARGADGLAPIDWLATALVLLCFPIAAAYDLLAARHFARFGYGSPLPLVAIAAAGTAALLLWVRAGRPLRWGGTIAVAVGVAHRLASVAVFPADERRSDMLFMIARSLDLWRAGKSAYTPVQAAIYGDGGLAMPYFPGTWLAHVPAHALGVDLRLGGILVTLGLGVAVVVSLRSRRSELLAVLVFASPYHLYRHDLYFDHFLVLTAVLFAWAAIPGARAWPWIGVLAGVAAATRQWAWIYGPFVLLAAVTGARDALGHAPWQSAVTGPGARAITIPHHGARSPGDRGRRADAPEHVQEVSGSRGVMVRLAVGGAIAAVAGAAVCLPGIFPDPSRFRAVLRLMGMGAEHGELCLGFTSAAIAAGLTAWLRPAQLVVALATFAHALAGAARERAAPPAILATGWFALVAVIAFSTFLENYFWLTPSFAALGLALGADRAAAANGLRATAPGAGRGTASGQGPGIAPLAPRGA